MACLKSEGHRSMQDGVQKSFIVKVYFFCLIVCILFESVIFAIVLIIITRINYRAQFPNGSQHFTKNNTF